jgi:tetratricopeptide (TPR) repeat protein
MITCDYHPLSAATFACPDCNTDLCDTCCNEAPGRTVRCFLCDAELTPAAANNQAEPFWRRFDKAFRYALSPQALILIVGVSIISTIAGYLPLSTVWYLAAFAALMKYSFSCLQATAAGNMEAPEISTAFGGGLSLLLRLLVIFIVLSVSIGGAVALVGPTLGAIVGIIAISALPASLIIFAMTDRLSSAVNPLQSLHLMASIGLPYGLLLAILLVMTGSVQVISELLGEDLSLLSLTLNAVVSNYYSIVTFHIMGYMLFQYQHELGFESAATHTEPQPREKEDWVLAKAHVLVKEGRFDEADAHFANYLGKLPSSKALYNHYFEFLFATQTPLRPATGERLAAFGSKYLRFLLRHNQEHKLLPSYARLTKALPAFQPDDADTRYRLAKACDKAGQKRQALRLLNGLHKQFPDYRNLLSAYRMLAAILETSPEMTTQAQRCRELLEKLEQRSQPVT